MFSTIQYPTIKPSSLYFKLAIIFLFLFLILGCNPSQSQYTSKNTTTQNEILYTQEANPFLEVLNEVIESESKSWDSYDYKNFRDNYLTNPWNNIIIKTLNFELDLNFDKSIPNAGEILENEKLNNIIWFPTTTSWKIIQNGVVDLLNRNLVPGDLKKQARFEIPYFDFRVVQEFSDEAKNKWLLEINSSFYNVFGWVPIEFTGNQFELIPNDLPFTNQYFKSGLQIRILPDVNNDGQKDIMIVFEEYNFGSSYVKLEIFSALDAKINRIWELSYQPLNKKYPYKLISKNNFTRIQIQNKKSANWDCDWVQFTDYHWIGSKTIKIIHHSFPPNTPTCNLAQAISPTSNLSTDQKITIIEESIPSFNDQPEILTLLKIHLGINYLANGKTSKAQQVLDTIYQIEGDTGFLSLVKLIYQKTNSAPYLFCEKLIENIRSIKFNNPKLVKYFSPYNHFLSYGSNQYSFELLLCPIINATETHLQNLSAKSQEKPDQILMKTFGRAVPNKIKTNLDFDPDDEWIIQLGYTFPLTVISDNIDNTWHFYLVSSVFGSSLNGAFLVNDLNQNKTDADHYLIVKPDTISNVPHTCNNTEENELFVVLKIANAKNKWKTMVYYICLNPNKGSINENVDIIKLLRMDANDSNDIPNFEKIIDHLNEINQTEVNTQNINEFLNEISIIQSGISSNTSNFQYKQEYLYYMTGLAYELENSKKEANMYFSKIISFDIQSPWEKLARSKLKN